MKRHKLNFYYEAIASFCMKTMDAKHAFGKRKEIARWLLLLFILPYSALAISSVIRTSTGKVRGTIFPCNEKHVQAFLGIPYAKPPVGDLRFKRTEPVQPWNKTLRATNLPPACVQDHPPNYPWVDTMRNQSEDCLYLNIWVPPNTNKDSKKAVMFWIHGGGYETGSTRLPVYDGRVFASVGDTILVTINYRLGILGFLSTTSDEAPGNMGLFDMLEALKWVNKNIEAFGGDCNRITLGGESAGAIAIGCFCTSPLTEGLYQRVILESSSSANDLNDGTAVNLKLGQQVAEALGCSTPPLKTLATTPADVVKCLRDKTPEQLVKATAAVKTEIFSFLTIAQDKFLPINPKVQLIAGNVHDVDVLFGFNQDEGSFAIAANFHLFGEKNPKFNKTTGEGYIREMFKLSPYKEVVVKYYLGGLKENDYIPIRSQTYHSIGEYIIVCPGIYFGEVYAKKGNNVYAYYFNHIPTVHPWRRWMGSAHFYEVAFVFGRPLDSQSNYTTKEQCLSRRMIKIWTNFAKTGCPGENWGKFSKENQTFEVLQIGARKSYLEEHKKNCEYFRSLEGFVLE